MRTKGAKSSTSPLPASRTTSPAVTRLRPAAMMTSLKLLSTLSRVSRGFHCFQWLKARMV
ncbi:hypothetical protein GMD93_08545 [Pseudoflavonifractor sp. BIOML-A4]|nr:hypothetical protein [Pseudoflavonifractor sp. BIOML-A4]